MNRFWIARPAALRLLAVAGIVLLSSACAKHFYPEAPSGWIGSARVEQEKTLPEWIGKDRRDLVDKMGEPRMAVPMESGAEELYYSYQGHKYYFETDLKGRIKTAVQTD